MAAAMAMQQGSRIIQVVRRAAASAVATSVDLLFPKRCVGCDVEGAFLCGECSDDLPLLEPPYCFICSQPGDLMMRLCARCWERPLQIDGIRSPYRFEGAIRNAVHSLKYRNLRAMAPVLAGLLADFVVSQSIEADLLVPAPLHPKRERSRGYNQSLLLARENRRAVEHGDKQRRLAPCAEHPFPGVGIQRGRALGQRGERVSGGSGPW